MKSPKISVIIPAYNEEKYIGDCLRAVMNQTTEIPYETIVVDNNSSDNTAIIAKHFPCVIVKQKKHGAPSARNKGARIARGKILIFLDADCTVGPKHIEHVNRIFKQSPEVDIIAGPYILHDGGFFVRFITEKGKYYQRFHEVVKFLFGHQGFSGGNFAIKRSVYIASKGFDESLNVVDADDAEYGYRLSKLGYHAVFESSIPVLTSARRMKKNSYYYRNLATDCCGTVFFAHNPSYRLNHSS